MTAAIDLSIWFASWLGKLSGRLLNHRALLHPRTNKDAYAAQDRIEDTKPVGRLSHLHCLKIGNIARTHGERLALRDVPEGHHQVEAKNDQSENQTSGLILTDGGTSQAAENACDDRDRNHQPDPQPRDGVTVRFKYAIHPEPKVGRGINGEPNQRHHNVTDNNSSNRFHPSSS